jgi:Zn-dependent M28 family amino/carboxypeptidase
VRRSLLGVLMALGLVLGVVAAAPAGADTKSLPSLVKTSNIRKHQKALQQISDANGGNRAVGSPGYEISVKYVKDQLKRAGYKPVEQEFNYPYYEQTAPTVFEQVSPNAKAYAETTDAGATGDFGTFDFSGNGDVTAPIGVVDPDSADSGCEAADFAGFTAGNIALVKRGTCFFEDKARNAVAAGAVGILIYNDAADPTREGPVVGTLGVPFTIPAAGPSAAVGQELVGLAAQGPVTVHLKTTVINEERTSKNVIADWSPKGARKDNVIVVGAHLDSVPEGPGINDNGSGTATNLEIAKQLTKLGKNDVKNTVRFGFWGAEELGLWGSTRYVESLSDAELAKIALNLNFDMLGSPNFVRFVYDGDNSAFPVGPGAADGPEGSGEIERVFTDYFASQGLASSETPFSGRSDYGPFIAIGIPAGGLFSGAEGLKTAAEQAAYGGTAGAAYDPCYHQACDTYNNNSDTGLHQLSDAAAQATLLFAKRNFVRRPLVDPATPVSGTAGASLGGGGLRDDHEEVAR